MNPRTARRPTFVDRSGQRRHRPDYMLLVFASILLVLGLIVVYAISPSLSIQKQVSVNYFIIKQLTAILLGVVGFVVVSSIPLNTWKHLQKPLIALAGLATLVALVLPTTPEYPAHRWIRFGGLSLQSVELIKLALLVCLAAFLARQVANHALADSKKTLQPLMVIVGVIAVVVGIAQKDLGSLGVLVAIMAAMGFIAGLPMRKVLMAGGVFAIGLTLLILPFSYRRDRVLTFMHPERDCQNAGYQACQALIAVGSGGIIGKGLGQGAQSSGYVPEAANDSIFAVMGEKFGFLGASLLICLFTALFIRIKNIMDRAPDVFSRLIVSGILGWFSTQTLINIGAMIGLLPLKGITLPFISYGGTSIIFVLAALGLVFQISRYTTFGSNTETERASHENTVDWRRDRRSYHANPSSRT